MTTISSSTAGYPFQHQCSFGWFSYEEFEDTKDVIRTLNRGYNDQKKKGQKGKQRSTKHTHKTKDWATGTCLNNGVNSGTPEG